MISKLATHPENVFGGKVEMDVWAAIQKDSCFLEHPRPSARCQAPARPSLSRQQVTDETVKARALHIKEERTPFVKTLRPGTS